MKRYCCLTREQLVQQLKNTTIKQQPQQQQNKKRKESKFYCQCKLVPQPVCTPKEGITWIGGDGIEIQL